MNIQIFTFCEFAQSINGKTTIVGTFNRITPQAFPFTMPDLFVVVKLVFNEDVEEKVSLALRKKNGNEIISTGEQPLAISRVKNKEYIHDIILRINHIVFKNPGEYEAVFKIGDKEYSINLYIDSPTNA